MAKHAGFCYGVKRAVETTKKLKLENKDTYICVLGELIHNMQVIDQLESLGIHTVNKLDEKNNGICVIRSHGTSPQVIKEIQNKGYKIVDLTCPDVKKVQKKAIELVKDGFLLLILGKSEHPEVIAIEAHAKEYGDNIFVIPDIESIKSLEKFILKSRKIGVVIQTTQRIEFLKEIVNYLIPITKDLRIVNTICPSTALRQTEARNLASSSDLMVVVGSKKSANTSHLAEILSDITKTIHIETADELENFAEIIDESENIAVTAGASTPDNIIQDVLHKLNNFKI